MRPQAMFNLKNKAARSTFITDVCTTKSFSNVFKQDTDFTKHAKSFLKTFERKLFKSFKKVRIKTQGNFERKNPDIEALLIRKASLMRKSIV